MKAAVSLEHFANLDTTAPEYREKLKPVFSAGGRVDWVWPVGTEVTGDKAKELVRFGLAAPLDEECATACGMTAADIANAQKSQEMAQKGIHSRNDQTLYLAGVIAGYESDGKGGVKYVPGPNWNAYKAKQEAKQEAAKKETADE